MKLVHSLRFGVDTCSSCGAENAVLIFVGPGAGWYCIFCMRGSAEYQGADDLYRGLIDDAWRAAFKERASLGPTLGAPDFILRPALGPILGAAPGPLTPAGEAVLAPGVVYFGPLPMGSLLGWDVAMGPDEGRAADATGGGAGPGDDPEEPAAADDAALEAWAQACFGAPTWTEVQRLEEARLRAAREADHE